MANTTIPVELSSTPGIIDNSNATAITIDGSGKLLVGSTANLGTALLNVAGGIDVADSDYPYLKLKLASNESIVEASGQYQNMTVGGTGANAYLRFKTADTERMRIDSSGNVGIGVTPTAKLHIAGTIQSQTGSSVAQMYSDGGAAFFASVGAFPSVFTTNGTERLRIDSSGNVGIGTSSPDTLLEVVGADPILTIRDTETSGALANATLRLAESGASDTLNNYWDINHTNNSELRFVSSIGLTTAERLRIDSSGNVGIGTSNPLVQLHLSKAGGTLIKLGTSQNSCEIEAREVGSGNSLVFSSNNSVDHLVIDSSGNVLVGTTNLANIAGHTPNVVTDLQFGCNDGSYISSFGIDRIHFNVGNFYVVNQGSTGVKLVNGATSWTTQSDENSKENIVELSGALTAVNAMRCVRYNLKSQTSDDVKIGFIAQDWQSSYPEVVATDTDGTLGMNYTETIPVLLKAIQEQQTIIESLTARITTLEG